MNISIFHSLFAKPLLSAIFFNLFILFTGSSSLYAASASLSWDANSEPDLAGYNIYQRTLPSIDFGAPIFSGLPSNPSSPQLVVNNLNAGISYGFIATAFDFSGNESSPSLELHVTPTGNQAPPTGTDINDAPPPVHEGTEEDSAPPPVVEGSEEDSTPPPVVEGLEEDSAPLPVEEPGETRSTENGFTAYNDLAWGTGQLTNNITTITSPKGKGASGLPSSGQLLNFATGVPTPVSLTVTGGRLCQKCPNRARTKQPKPGTDAHSLFNGIISGQGAVQDLNKKKDRPLVLRFTGMDPSKVYDLAFYSHRNKFGWDRASLVTLSGQMAFTNSSSIATDNPNKTGGVLFSGPTDPSTRLPADNDNGYVARFSNIDPGSDGVVVLTISYDGSSPFKGKYGSAVRLQENSISSDLQ